MEWSFFFFFFFFWLWLYPLFSLSQKALLPGSFRVSLLVHSVRMPACPARRRVVRGVYWIRTLQTGRLMTRVRHLLNKGEKKRRAAALLRFFFSLSRRERENKTNKKKGSRHKRMCPLRPRDLWRLKLWTGVEHKMSLLSVNTTDDADERNWN